MLHHVTDAHAVEIIAVGSELLTPHRVDTNSLFLTGRLNELGLVVQAKTIVGDDRVQLASMLRASLGRAGIVIMTGGLGPTDDDLTREVTAHVLGCVLDHDDAILESIRQRFDRRGLTMPAINARQAQVLRGAEVLVNPAGTAPGQWIRWADRLVVLLPGPPREMQPMFDTHVAPRLREIAPGRMLRRRVLKITGRSESQVEEIAFPIYAQLGDHDVPVETTILAAPGQIELHLSASGTDQARLDERLALGVAQLAAALGDVVFSVDGRSLEEVAGQALAERGWRIAVAESCTGGLVLSRLTDVPGSSAWVQGGVVAYANVVKEHELDVPAALIAAHGAVSDPVAHAMAEGVRRRLGADVGVGITGVAGPTGGTLAKPVGTVVIACMAADGPAVVRTFTFPGGRELVRRFASAAALDMVRRACAP